ncbi:MAG: hypothetical protein ACREU7_07310, partial [Burkholderiales bacterium]
PNLRAAAHCVFPRTAVVPAADQQINGPGVGGSRHYAPRNPRAWFLFLSSLTCPAQGKQAGTGR